MFITIPGTNTIGNKAVTLRGDGNYNVECSNDAVGTIMRLENFLKKLETELTDTETRLISLNNEMATAKIEVAKGFEYADTISEMSDELASIDAELDLNKQEIAATVIDDEQFKDEVAPVAPDEDESSELDDEDDKPLKKVPTIVPSPIMEPDLNDSNEIDADDFEAEFDEDLELENDVSNDYEDNEY